MSYLVATAWVKDEGSYLKEWIDFHLCQGFEKFYIYDNNSTDNTLEVLQPYIEKGQVEVRYYPEGLSGRKNFWVMRTTIDEFKDKHTWLFHHSIDEFIYCKNGIKVSEFLKGYEDFPGVVIPWRLFNSSGHVKRENGRIIDRFTKYVNDDSFHIKTIIQPKFTIDSVGNPHSFFYTAGEHVYSDKTVAHRNGHSGANGHFNNYNLDDICINHYVTMSRDEFNIKMNKGILDFSSQEENARRSSAEQQWYEMHSKPEFYNNDLVNYEISYI